MRIIPIAGLVLMVALSGCTRDTAPAVTCQPCAAATVSFTTDVIPVFKSNCATIGCHTGSPNSGNGNVSLDSAVAYQQCLHPGTGYVVASDPNSSILYSQLLAGFPNHMPVGGQLSACDIQKIYCWIQQGALDN